MITLHYDFDQDMDGREALAFVRMLLSAHPHLRGDLGMETRTDTQPTQSPTYADPKDPDDGYDSDAATAFAPKPVTISPEEFARTVSGPAPASDEPTAASAFGSPEAPATATATAAPITATNPHGLVDHKGTPYHVDFHSSPAKINTDGKWRAKRGVTAEAPGAAPAAAPAPAPVAAVAPPPPTATPVAPPPPTAAAAAEDVGEITFSKVMELNKELTAAGKLSPGEIMVICKESVGADLGAIMKDPGQLVLLHALLKARA